MSKSQETKKQISGTDIVGLISAVLAIISSLVDKNKNTEAKLDEKNGISITLNDAPATPGTGELSSYPYSKPESVITSPISLS